MEHLTLVSEMIENTNLSRKLRMRWTLIIGLHWPSMQAKLYRQQIVALASYDANFQVEYFQLGVLFKTSNLPGNGIFKFCLWTIRCFLKQSFKTILSGKINMSKKWTGFHDKEMPNMTTSTGTSILGASIFSGKVFSSLSPAWTPCQIVPGSF